jgi:hypothetical protein
VLRAFTGVVHDRQRADYDYRQGEEDQYGGFHCDLATAGPNTFQRQFLRSQNEPTMNAQDGIERLIPAQICASQ